MTPEEKWARDCGMGFSMTGNTINVDRLALRMVLARMEYEAEQHAKARVKIEDMREVLVKISCPSQGERATG